MEASWNWVTPKSYQTIHLKRIFHYKPSKLEYLHGYGNLRLSSGPVPAWWRANRGWLLPAKEWSLNLGGPWIPRYRNDGGLNQEAAWNLGIYNGEVICSHHRSTIGSQGKHQTLEIGLVCHVTHDILIPSSHHQPQPLVAQCRRIQHWILSFIIHSTWDTLGVSLMYERFEC